MVGARDGWCARSVLRRPGRLTACCHGSFSAGRLGRGGTRLATRRRDRCHRSPDRKVRPLERASHRVVPCDDHGRRLHQAAHAPGRHAGRCAATAVRTSILNTDERLN
eukprot:6560325-Prymnesium_polylepis.1